MARRRKGRALCAAAVVCLGAGCSRADTLFCDGAGCAFSSREWARLGALALARLEPPPGDPTNAAATDPAAVELGRRFFSDARFSGPSNQLDALGRPAAVGRAPAGQAANVSCASCHDLERGGADTASIPGNVSSGAGWTDVNALPIANLAYDHLYTWNGRADSLWAQAFAVAENPLTMNGDRLNTMHVIFEDYLDDYVAVFGSPAPPIVPRSSVYPAHGKPGVAAYDGLPQDVRDGITRVQVNWAKALAAYEATLATGETPFDRFIAEGPTSDAISAAAKRGARLFVGKAGCIDCHDTPLLSDGGFHNVGVPQAGPHVPTVGDCSAGNAACDCVGAGSKCLPWGAYDGAVRLHGSAMTRTSVWSDAPDDMSRVEDVQRTPTDALKGAWRTPSLRNVALTAPYMHDGIYKTLPDVVAHYSRGPDTAAVGVPAPDIKPLLLTEGEKSDLVAFLTTLSSNVGGRDGGASSSVDGRAPGERGAGGAVPGVELATFDVSSEGFVIDLYDTPSNLARYNAGVAPTASWDGTEGSPAAGSIKLTVPFTEYQQSIVLRRDIPGLVDWTGKTLHVRVKIASGFNPDPAFPGGAQLFAQSTTSYFYAGQYSNLEQTTSWQTIAFALDSATEPGFDAHQVIGFGILLTSGAGDDADGGVASGKPAPAVVLVDSFSLE